MRKNFLKPFILAFAAILFAGCASITKGKYQEITVESNVPGVIVELGYTPFNGKIKKSKEAARQGINEALEESKGNQVMFGDALIERFRRR